MMSRILIVILVFLDVSMVTQCFGQDSAEAESSAEKRSRSIDELLLFFPTKYPNGNWKPKDLDFQDVFFTADDGTKLHGWYCPVENPRAVILAAHGNAGHVASRTIWLRYLQDKANVSVFMFDYRGYGRSEGVPTIKGAIQDALAAQLMLCELAEIKSSEMLLMGESLGGAIVVQVAAKSAPRGLILQSTFSSLRDVAEIHYPSLAWLVSLEKLDSVTQIAGFHGHVLQSHGTADKTIPIDSGKKLFQAANEPKQFILIENAGHNNWMTREYLLELDEFIEKTAGQ